jgi:hypothetical protein
MSWIRRNSWTLRFCQGSGERSFLLFSSLVIQRTALKLRYEIIDSTSLSPPLCPRERFIRSLFLRSKTDYGIEEL